MLRSLFGPACYDILVARWSTPAPHQIKQEQQQLEQRHTSEQTQVHNAPLDLTAVQPTVEQPAAAEVPVSASKQRERDAWLEGARKARSAAKAWQYQVAEEDDEVTEFVNMKLQAQADAWPESAPAAPRNDDEALDPNGPWGLHACGVAIRRCEDDDAKGLGAFATRTIRAGSVVGVYWGEVLTQRAHTVRHGWRSGTALADVTYAEQCALEERRARLAALGPRAPMHGADNGSAYCFSVLPDDLLAALGSTMLPSRPAYIDGEDPDLSSWCRFINHCSEAKSARCNLEPKCDGFRCLVWFEARRDIGEGEELAFDYSEHYRWDTPGSGLPERHR